MNIRSVSTIKKQQEEKLSALLKECSVFFAFSDKQFQENKTPLKEGEKYVHIGGGGYLPKGKLEHYLDGSKAIRKWFKDEIKQNKLRKEHILDELRNHEAFYTGEIEDTLETLGKDYDEAEVRGVFNEQRKVEDAW